MLSFPVQNLGMIPKAIREMANSIALRKIGETSTVSEPREFGGKTVECLGWLLITVNWHD